MQLFPHNREAYESAVRLFKKENRVCIIRPTGTGKSLIIAEFINRNPSARHLLLAPGAHIFNEIQKYVPRVRVAFSTYIGVKTNRSLLGHHSFDFIYLDEFHRLGAKVWGNNVNRLLQRNPQAKVLGTSATPIRYLDDNRNMATDIFEDHVAAQMSLTTAVATGILPPPIYISALYSIKDEMQEMKRKILLSGSKDKDGMVRELDRRVIDWERSSGLDMVIKKHLTSDRRRVIVFCKDWNHLQYARNVLSPIFEDIFGAIQSVSIYSKMKEDENEASMELFSGEEKQAIILFTIDKVNEGLHVRNCNTVILLRDTISPIVFYQQIGRAFSVGGTSRPMIIDLVNNFTNLNLVSFRNDLEKELKSPSPNRRTSDNERRARTAIEIIDETQDIRNIFSAFEERVDTWMTFYKEAKKFYEEHGHLYVPHDDKELSAWVRKQRYDCKKQAIAQERIELLEAIGMVVIGDISAQWWMRYYEFKKWVRIHGDLPTVSKNRALAFWIGNTRADFKNGKLTDEQIKLLEPLFPLSGNRTRLKMEARMERLITHFKKGDIYSMSEQIKKDLKQVKDLHLRNSLNNNDLIYLRNGNVPVEITMNDLEWLANVKRAIAWYKANGDLPLNKEDSALYLFWTREEKYINNAHFYAKFINLNKDAEESVKELQEIICKVRSSRAKGRPRVASTENKEAGPASAKSAS